jgi:hypothetical protein
MVFVISLVGLTFAVKAGRNLSRSPHAIIVTSVLRKKVVTSGDKGNSRDGENQSDKVERTHTSHDFLTFHPEIWVTPLRHAQAAPSRVRL